MTQLIYKEDVLQEISNCDDEIFVTEAEQEYLWERIQMLPLVDAIPIEFIRKEIKDLEDSLDFYGSIGEYDALRIDAMYQYDALTGLLRQWKAERKEE